MQSAPRLATLSISAPPTRCCNWYVCQRSNHPCTTRINSPLLRPAGAVTGIGVEITLDSDSTPVVMSPAPGGPAEQAGVKAGDRIVTVDGRATQGLTLYEAGELLQVCSGWWGVYLGGWGGGGAGLPACCEVHCSTVRAGGAGWNGMD